MGNALAGPTGPAGPGFPTQSYGGSKGMCTFTAGTGNGAATCTPIAPSAYAVGNLGACTGDPTATYNAWAAPLCNAGIATMQDCHCIPDMGGKNVPALVCSPQYSPTVIPQKATP
jgi:hypothetical protein